MMGFNNDPNMDERVQVTLVVTGLVGRNLMELLNAPERDKIFEKQPFEETVENDFTYIQRKMLSRLKSEDKPEVNYIKDFSKYQIMKDLDTPAYMRKKLRNNENTAPLSGD